MELIEEERVWVASAALYLVKIGFQETGLRERVKAAGGQWNRERKLWMAAGAVVRRLGLEGRVAEWVEVE